MHNDLAQHALEDLIETVVATAEGRELANPDKEFILSYYLTHQDDPSIETMLISYYEAN